MLKSSIYAIAALKSSVTSASPIEDSKSATLQEVSDGKTEDYQIVDEWKSTDDGNPHCNHNEENLQREFALF